MDAARVAFAIITALIAQTRGRSFVLWAILGGVLPCVAIIILMLLPSVEEAEEDARAPSDRAEGPRHRRDEFGHDGRHRPDRPLGPLAALPRHHPLADREWWYARPEHEHYRGPFRPEELDGLIRCGEVDADTLIWCDRYGDWQPARNIREIAEEISRRDR